MRNIICDKSGDIICENIHTDVYRFNEMIEDEFGSYSFLYFSIFTKDFFIGDESSGEDFTLEASKKIKELMIMIYGNIPIGNNTLVKIWKNKTSKKANIRVLL